MKRVFAISLIVVLGVAVVMAVKTVGYSSMQLDVEPVNLADVDASIIARHVSEGIRFRTVSTQDASQFPEEEFIAFRHYLEQTYPRVHAQLNRELISGHSILFRWDGARPELEPGLLAAHYDVVPIDPGSEGDWVRPPFSGDLHDGHVWGRGAMDDKASLFCILEAVETLVAEGFRPNRTLYLAFGHDEEVGGDTGALKMSELLQSRGVELAYVIDEGGTVTKGLISVIDRPVAVIGIAEKGSVSIGMSVEAPGGHSSTPPAETAVGILSAAVSAVERNPMPASIGDTTRLMLRYIGPELGLPARLVLSNLWLFGGILGHFAGSEPAFSAMLRTTTAATIFHAGVKENVLPRNARAIVNFRILPGDTADDVVEHVRSTIADERVVLQVGVRSPPREPSEVSRVDSENFRVLQRTIGEVFGGAVVAPYLVVGGTDARHYQPLTTDAYRFGPFVFGRDALKLAHGTNERISIDDLANGVRFYLRFIRNSSG